MSPKHKKDLIISCLMTVVFFMVIAHCKAPFYMYLASAAMVFGLFGLNVFLERSSDKTLPQRMDKHFEEQSLEYDKFRQDFSFEYPVKGDILSDLKYRYTRNPLAISFSSPVKNSQRLTLHSSKISKKPI